jgi:hypothetical protein
MPDKPFVTANPAFHGGSGKGQVDNRNSINTAFVELLLFAQIWSAMTFLSQQFGQVKEALPAPQRSSCCHSSAKQRELTHWC